MKCNNPKNYWLRIHSVTKKPVRVYRESESQLFSEPLKQECGQCRQCRINKKREQAVRQVNEAFMHPCSCMVTLTYADEFLPTDGSVSLDDHQKFIKRLRYYHPAVRYAGVAEYGKNGTERPHFHYSLFGYGFQHDRIHSGTRDGFKVYNSAELRKIWPFGVVEVGEFTTASAEYICKHNTEKVTGSRAIDHYKGRKPEFYRTSRKPALGHDFVMQFGTDIYPHDMVHVGSRSCYKVPKYYDVLWERLHPEEMEAVKLKRKQWVLDNLKRNLKEETPLRRAQKEEYLKYMQEQRARSYVL